LYDSLYVVGGNAKDQTKFDLEVMKFINLAYEHYKPIGVATTAGSYMKKNGNLEGVVFAAESPDFAKDFVAAITKQRFWGRT
ncbi:MAG TPA: catalase HPII, partial [Clostridia bacterium]|nr:catalase HPII [Clostridia bacterium]